MKKIVLSVLLLTGIYAVSNAQSLGSSYKTAVGGKFYFGDGTLGGINIKHFTNNHSALEGSLLFGSGAVGVEGLYEWHGDIPSAAGLQYYIGGGGLLLFSTTKGSDDKVGFGLRGTIGLDYKFSGAPVDVAFGLDPVFQLAPGTDFNFAAGLAFRFAF